MRIPHQSSSFAVPVAQPQAALPAPQAPGLVFTQQLSRNDWAPIDSKASRLKRMQRKTLTLANIIQRVFPLLRCWMVTLTYAPEIDWQPEQISKSIRAVREWCRRQRVKFRFAWVLEQHKSGRVHYHVCVWLPRHLQMPKWDKRGWWPHGMTNTQKARFAPGYIAKYVSKGTKQWKGDGADYVPIPKGARLHDSGGLDGIERIELRWWMMPRWLRERLGFLGEAQRARGGWVCKETAEFVPSPYEVIFRHGIAWWRLKIDPPAQAG